VILNCSFVILTLLLLFDVGNSLNANDIKILLSKLVDHPNIKNLNLSHNQLDEEGGKYLAEWLVDNHVLLNLDISWCSIRLLGA
ncbi:unnamed protein product, partial [Rotaria magnacalcarata]